MFTQYNHETGKTKLTKLAKGGIITIVKYYQLRKNTSGGKVWQ